MRDADGIDHTWNHRVMLHAKADAGDDYYVLTEVHYDAGIPRLYADNATVGGNSIEELRETLERMLRALDKPVLTPADFPQRGAA